MMKMLGNFVLFIWLKFKVTSNLAAENLALRHQLAVMKRTNKRPKIRMVDRLFWVLLSRIWTPWRKSLIIVKPDTVVYWHRKGFKLFWKFKSKGPGRPQVSREIRDLVRRMAAANPNWGAPRIHGELLSLGFEVSERTVSNLMPRHPPNSKPSQTWRTFLKNHINKCSIDFFTVPTVTFNILFVLVILSHSRRKVVHFNITSNPTAEWTTQQIVEAFPWDTAPKYLMRDRDAIYGVFFRNRVKNMGIKEVVSVPQSPWQNPFVERVIGSIRRECANNVIVLNQGHLKNILCAYFQYYHNDRTHLSLGKNTPNGRPIQPRSVGKCKIIDLPRIGGLHHRYEWKKAA
ncbi:integrase core domain-containing protein [uncultured Desulfobacter sp.]|uniref:integrase core domain-containing protein n=1 Tax=uncultured Desulfobacter sp. TaxID=240139 RepID=UPI0029F4B7FC|nr:integrase core domain-containing protein [uncultured Desulfobacter sp.]